MDINLNEFILSYLDDSLIETMQSLARIEESLGGSNIREGMLQLSTQPSDSDRIELSDAVYRLLESVATSLLAQFEVKLADTAKLKDIAQVLECLTLIESNLDHARLWQLATSPLESIESFALMCEEVSILPAQHYLAILESVSDSLIEKIGELHSTDIQESIDTSYVYETELRRALHWLMNRYPDTLVWAAALMKAGMNPSGTFNWYYSQLAHRFEAETNPANLAIQIFALLWLGVDSQATAYGWWRAHSEQLFDDVATIQAVDSVLSKMIRDYETYRASLIMSEKY